MLRCVFLAVSAMLLVACATITRGKSSPLIPRARRGQAALFRPKTGRRCGHDPGIGDPFQGVELASNPMHEGVLSARIEHHSVERRKYGCWQCDLRRHHRTWGRCRLRGDEQIPRRGHCRDDAGSGMPRPGTGPAEPGTAAAHLGAVVFRADPRARGGAGTFSGWRWLRRRPFRRLKLSSWSRQGNDRLRRHSAVLQQCVSRPARQLESQYCSWERTIGSRIQTPKQANKQAIALRQQTILLLLIFCNVIDLFAPMRRPLSFRENLPCPLAL